MSPATDAHPDEDLRIDLALRAMALKDEPRRGWVLRSVEAPESVAGHAWGTALLCLLFADAAGVDPGRSVAIAVLHDIAEAETGDVATRADAADREMSESEKTRRERAAITQLLPESVAHLRALWQAYEDRADPEAVFVRDMNLIDMCLQGLIYQQERRYDPLATITSRGEHAHLDEFFASAGARLSTPLAKRLFERVEVRYRAAKRADEPAR
ncbi:MAG: HD domain-containing protein [Trueperaceae bacterium]